MLHLLLRIVRLLQKQMLARMASLPRAVKRWLALALTQI
jgi:hypothetical protein